MTHPSVAGLPSRWSRDVARAAGPDAVIDASVVDAVWAEVAARYGEPHRRYHTLDHVAAVLDTIDELLNDEAVRRDVPDADAVVLAGWLHDVIYDPIRHDNEERSAVWAQERLTKIGVPAATVDEVRRLIVLTAGHEVEATDVAGAVLVDADLAILGAPPTHYDRYAAAIRAEYDHVPDDAYETGRSAVLQSFLERVRLFHTDAVHDGRDATARSNLAREIAGLRRVAAP